MGLGKKGLFFGLIILIGQIFIWPGLDKVWAKQIYYTPPVDTFEANVNVDKFGKVKINENIILAKPTPLVWMIRLPSFDILEVDVDGKTLAKKEYRLIRVGHYKRLVANANISGTHWQIKLRADKNFSLTNRLQIFRWEVFVEPETMIRSVSIVLKSDVPFGSDKSLRYRVFAYHGAGAAKANIIDNQTVEYTGELIGPKAGFTIMASWPRSTLQFGWLQKTLLDFTVMELIFWMAFGLILPIFVLIILILMNLRRRAHIKYSPSGQIKDKPPNDIPSFMIGILFEKKIYPHVLLAAILDLCRRGYLIIIREDKKYIFGKRKKIDSNLRDWEKRLLEAIFATEPLWTDEAGVRSRSNNQLFSPKIMEIFEDAYKSATNLGYFTENPHWVRVKFKVVGIILYLLALIGILWMVLTMQPAFLLIPLGGVLLATIVIIRLAPMMPQQSQKGYEEMYKWSAFKNYLCAKELFPAHYSIGGLFYEYLPYAIALGVEKDWMKRFSNYRLVMPDWYLASDALAAERAVADIMTIIKHLSRALGQLKGPAVS